MTRGEYISHVMEKVLPDLPKGSIAHWRLDGCDLIICPNDFGEENDLKGTFFCDGCPFKDYWDKEMPDERMDK